MCTGCAQTEISSAHSFQYRQHGYKHNSCCTESHAGRGVQQIPANSATSGPHSCASAQLISVAVRFQDLAVVGPRSTDPCNSSKSRRTGCTAKSGQFYLHCYPRAQLIPVAVRFQDATVAGPRSAESRHSRKLRGTGRTANSGQVYLRGCASAQLIPASAFLRRSSGWPAPS